MGAFEFGINTVQFTSIAEGVTVDPSTVKNSVSYNDDFSFDVTKEAGKESWTLIVKITPKNGAQTTLTPTGVTGAVSSFNIEDVIDDVEVVVELNKPTGIDVNEQEAQAVYAIENSLFINGSGIANVYTVQGMQCAQKAVSDSAEMTLPAGLYIVTFNGKAYKIILK